VLISHPLGWLLLLLLELELLLLNRLLRPRFTLARAPAAAPLDFPAAASTIASGG